MKAAFSILLGLCLLFGLVATVGAEEKGKEVTLKGNITCAKCELKESKKCETVIVVEDKDKKKVVYYFDADSHKKFHAKICKEGKTGTVKGTCVKKDDKFVVTVEECKFE